MGVSERLQARHSLSCEERQHGTATRGYKVEFLQWDATGTDGGNGITSPDDGKSGRCCHRFGEYPCSRIETLVLEFSHRPVPDCERRRSCGVCKTLCGLWSDIHDTPVILDVIFRHEQARVVDVDAFEKLSGVCVRLRGININASLFENIVGNNAANGDVLRVSDEIADDGSLRRSLCTADENNLSFCRSRDDRCQLLDLTDYQLPCVGVPGARIAPG